MSKFLLLFSVICFSSLAAAAQSRQDTATMERRSAAGPEAPSGKEKADTAKDVIRTAADLKTGNSQDVLVSFFQLAFNDLTGDNKSLKFQSSLFAIMAKTDTTLWVDSSYLRHNFARNFVFSIAPQLDSNFKFKGNELGLKYAIFNGRDKTVFDYASAALSERASIKEAVLEAYARTNPSDEDLDKAVDFFLLKTSQTGKQTPVDSLPKTFADMLGTFLAKSVAFKKMSLEDFQQLQVTEYARLSAIVENRALWTMEGSFTSDNSGKLFSRINLSSQFLKGLLDKNRRMNLELDLKATLNFDDDTLNVHAADMERHVFSFEGGFNWIMIKNRNNKSVLEWKGAVGYNNVLKGNLYKEEERSKFTAESTVRLRITDDIWIPFDVSYDPRNGNFLGFVSVRTNFDWLGKN